MHLLSLNLASAGPVVCMWLGRGKRADNFWRDSTGRQLAWASCGAMVVGMLLGGLLLLPSNPRLYSALARFPARTYWYAGIELAFSLACLLAYAATWQWRGRHRLLHGLLGLLTVTNLLYHFPPLMVVIAKLSANALWATEVVASGPIDHQAFLKLILRGEVLALSMHFMVASLVVAAMVTVWLLGISLAKNPGDIPDREPQPTDLDRQKLVGRAALMAILGTLAQIPVGIWILTTLPPASRQAVLGGHAMASLCFAVGIMTSLALVQQLLSIAQGEFNHPIARRSVWLLGVTVVLMIVTLRG
jgi:hypothetical protein